MLLARITCSQATELTNDILRDPHSVSTTAVPAVPIGAAAATWMRETHASNCCKGTRRCYVFEWH